MALTWLALRAIAFYQRHLSPRKGYRCALHATGGGRSCSAYGYRAIARGGLRTGLLLLRRRLDACAHAARLAQRRMPPSGMQAGRRHQRGFCDADCSVGDCADSTDMLDCCDGCDWPRRRKPRSGAALDDYLNNKRGCW